MIVRLYSLLFIFIYRWINLEYGTYGEKLQAISWNDAISWANSDFCERSNEKQLAHSCMVLLRSQWFSRNTFMRVCMCGAEALWFYFLHSCVSLSPSMWIPSKRISKFISRSVNEFGKYWAHTAARLMEPIINSRFGEQRVHNNMSKWKVNEREKKKRRL